MSDARGEGGPGRGDGRQLTSSRQGFYRSLDQSLHRAAHIAWIAVAGILFVFFAYNLPVFLQLAHSVCAGTNASNCATGELTPAYVGGLERLHIDPAVGEVTAAVLTFGVSALYWAFGLLIFWRRGEQWIGYLTSLLCIILGAVGLDAYYGSLGSPGPPIALEVINAAVGPGFVLLLLVFPTGRFAPRWTIGLFVLASVALALPQNSLPGGLASTLSGLAFICPAAIQVYRYARVYDAVARQQIKWFVFGICIVVSLVTLSGAFGPQSVWDQVFNGPWWLLIWTVLLLSVSIPILRYRLWDIDVLINRTLVYVCLTATLVGVYVGLILLLQGLIHLLTGSLAQQPLIIAVSTLVIAALFQPLRRAIQQTIDRRFYRTRYDAQRTLALLSNRLRDEVDIGQLARDLEGAVATTLQPQSLALWLRDDARGHVGENRVGRGSPSG